LAPSAQIIPICLIGAGSDEIGEAAQIGGYVRASTMDRSHAK